MFAPKNHRPTRKENLFESFLGSDPLHIPDGITLAKLHTTLEAFENASNLSFFVIDLKEHDFFYKSSRLASSLARYGDAAYGSSLEQFLHCIPESDVALYRDYGPMFCTLFNTIPGPERYSLVLSGSHRLITDRGYTMVYERVTPLDEDAVGNLSLSLCILRSSSAQQAGGVQITIAKGETKHVYSMSKKDWISSTEMHLSDREMEVLNLAARGLSTEKIADSIGLSPESVKRCRKEIMSKLETENIVQAVVKAQNLGMM